MFLNATVFSIGNLQKLIDNWYIFLTVLNMAGKTIGTYINHKYFHQIINLLSSDEFQAEDEESNKIIRKSIKKATKVRTLLIFWIVFAAILYLSVPLLDGSSKDFVLPLKAWFWFEIKYSPIYERIYVYQCISLIYQALIMAVIEGFIMGIMAVIIGQLELLAYKLRNIKSDGGLQCFDERVVNCVKHHRKIKLLTNNLQQMYGSSMFFHILVGGALLCLTGYHLSHLSIQKERVQFTIDFVYLIMIVGQLFLPCWYGSKIKDMSTQLNYALYESEWSSCLFSDAKMIANKNTTPRSKMTISNILMENGKRCIQVRASGLVSLDMRTCTSMINSAYSYYALLRNLQK
ncbi:odorant receptor 94a-like [Ctenocephalides felis]|uniref:odorant receptor 94a-like n=1 Tax=Ctenocephalides felis TaxID=7515 RepID=UPI000E6E101D|nr:odorant receptor 94a-like [Ctenocephalides felis]